ncbi:MAG: PAS domain S-box protein [Cyanobacteria bacterium J06643_4]
MADLSKFFELTSDLMCLADAQGRCQAVNEAFERIFGYSSSEMRDRTLQDLVHSEDRADYQTLLSQVSPGDAHQKITTRCQRKNGEWRWIAWSISAEPDNSLAAPQSLLYCVGHDITDRMDNLARYKLLADHATDIISRQTISGEYLYVSPACADVLGYSPEELIGRSRYDFIHADDATVIKANLAKVDQQADSFPLVFRAKHKQGYYVWMEAVHRKLYQRDSFDDYKVAQYSPSDVEGRPSDALNRPIESPSTDVYELIVVARDITKQQQRQQNIVQLNTDLETQVDLQTAALSAVQAKYEALLQTERAAHAQSEQAKAQAQLYADAVHNMPVGLYIWRLMDKDNPLSLEMIATNPAATTFTGISEGAIVGEKILNSFPALAETDIPETYAGVVNHQQAVDLGDVPYGDGRVQNGIFTVKAFPLAQDCVGISFENVTELRRQQTLRRDQKAQLKILFDQSAVGMARLSIEGQWIQVNQRLCDLLHYSMAELLKKTFREVTHPDDADIDNKVYAQLTSGARSQSSLEKRFLTRHGEIVWAHVTVSISHGESHSELHGESHSEPDQALYFIATIQDITAQKKATAALERQKNDLLRVNSQLTQTMSALEQRNQELDQFAYVTSHDLKAPLRAIANLATWIEEDIGADLPAENIEQFTLLKNRVHRMEGLIDGLLEYSRVGRVHQSRVQVDVGQLLIDVVDSLSPLGSFTVEVQPGMPVLMTEELPLIQVFSNLISNAIKHHDRQDGRVVVSVSEQDDFYEFIVADDGPGIAPKYHQRIFTIFQTLKARDDMESTGIGLSIVKKVITAEGGKITIESAEGSGTTFRFTWPKQLMAPNK